MTRKLNQDELKDIAGGTPNSEPQLIVGPNSGTTGEPQRPGEGGSGSGLEEEDLPGNGSGTPEYKG